MTTNNNIISFGTPPNKFSGKNMESSNTKAAIGSCRSIIKQSLPKCFNFFSQLDDSLFKLAEQAKTNQEQEDYFVAMRQFRITQENIKKSFTDLVLTDFDKFWQQPVQIAAVASELETPSSEMSLIQNDALEEEIALKKIVTKGEVACKAELAQLDMRFAVMMNTQQIIMNPLALSGIVQHLKTVISPVTENVTIAIKLLAYKQFEQHAVAELINVYKALNEELIKHGVLPKVTPEKRRKKTYPKPQSSTLSNDDSSNEFDDEFEDPAIFDELRNLLHKSSGSSETNLSNNGNSNTVALNTLVTVLSNLQHQPNLQPTYNDNGDLVLPDLQSTLQASLAQKQSDGAIVQQSMSHIDEDTLNVISLLFEFILGDQAIPAPIRALLAQLQLPMLKVAITDKTFFSKKNHTARRLLNNLAKVSTGWDHSNGTDDVLYNQINSIVTTILTDFETDLQIFYDLNTQLNQFMEQQEQSSDVAEQRIAKATEGQEKLIISQQEVDNTISQLLAKYSPVPKSVISLIDEGWKKVLRLRFLQKGKDSIEWKEAVVLLEELLWSVSPKTDPADRAKLIETIPVLLKSLRSSLSGASFNQHKITSLFKELQDCHVKCLNGSSLDEFELQNIEDIAEKEIVQPAEALQDVPEDKKVLSDEEALQKSQELVVGTWLEVEEEDGQTQRVKFSWRSNLTGRCLFVTYKGLKAAELSISELASWFQKGKAIVLEDADTPLMDRALISMKETIEH